MLEFLYALCIGLLIATCVLLVRRSNRLEQKVSKLSAALHKAEGEVKELSEKISEAYDVMEAQAKQEKRMFEGLNSIMDYDIGVARKAAGHGGE